MSDWVGTGSASTEASSSRTLASEIFAECDGVLLDANKVRWPDDEKLRYLNAGQRQAVIFKPDVHAKNEVYKLIAGTKQSIPDGNTSFVNPSGYVINEGIQLIKLVRNMGVTGLVAGAAITPVGMDILDAYNPNWHSATASAVVKNYVFNDEDPKHFYVTPPQPDSSQGYIEAIFSAVPTAIAALTGPSYAVAITISDIYRDVLVNYILHRCYAKDAALSPYNAQRSVEFWNLFVMGLDRKDLVKKEYSPNVKKANPSTE